MGQIVSGVMSIFGGFMSANSYLDSGDVQKKVQDQNAEIDEIKAKDSEARGELAVFRDRVNLSRLVGQQRAAFAASGIDVNEVDSVATNVIADSVKNSELDSNIRRMNAMREAWGYRQAAREDTFKGELAVWEAEQAAVGAMFSAGNSLYSKYGFSSDSGGSGGNNSGSSNTGSAGGNV